MDLTPLTNALQRDPFRGRVRQYRFSPSRRAAPGDAAIVVPARNEAARIASCLDHCSVAIAAAGADVRLVVVANNSTDETAEVVRGWAERQDRALDLVEVELADELAHAGAARRLAFEMGRHLVHEAGTLMCTDADSRPELGWVVTNLAEVRRGASLVCGRVVLDAAERAQLPGAFLADWAIEDAYRQASRELGQLIDPDPHNPLPHHGQVSGASLAIPAWAYDMIGGAPFVPVAEDRALAARIQAFDLPIRFSDAVRVITSGRLRGRAPGGMADTIRARLLLGDRLCDVALETAIGTLFRAELRARLRSAWRSGGLDECELRRLGLGERDRDRIMRQCHFGAAWAAIEASCPALRRVRLERAQLPGEHEQLVRLLARTREQQRAVSSRRAAAGFRTKQGDFLCS